MWHDFSKIKKKSGRTTLSKQKRIFAQNFRKIVVWIKVTVKMGENFVRTVGIICNNNSENTCKTFVIILNKFYKRL